MSSSSLFLVQNNEITPTVLTIKDQKYSKSTQPLNIYTREKERSTLKSIIEHPAPTGKNLKELRSLLFVRRKQVILTEETSIILVCFIESNPDVSSVNWYMNQKLFKTDSNLLNEIEFNQKLVQVVQSNFNQSASIPKSDQGRQI